MRRRLGRAERLDLRPGPRRTRVADERLHRAAFDERANVRLGTWLALGAAGLLMLLSLPWFPTAFQAWGNNLLATAILAGSLAWHIRHPPVAASSGAPAGLKPKIS